VSARGGSGTRGCIAFPRFRSETPRRCSGHRVGHYRAEGKMLTALTRKQIKAVEKTLRGKVTKRLSLATCKSHTKRGIRTFPPPRLRLTFNHWILHLFSKAETPKGGSEAVVSLRKRNSIVRSNTHPLLPQNPTAASRPCCNVSRFDQANSDSERVVPMLGRAIFALLPGWR
jgi:hypothetical protein